MHINFSISALNPQAHGFKGHMLEYAQGERDWEQGYESCLASIQHVQNFVSLEEVCVTIAQGILFDQS